jgi:hypothetical protein
MSTLKADTLVAADGTSPVTLTKQSAAKAWTNSGNSANPQDSFNIASGTDNGTGDYTYSLTNAFSNDDYSQPCSTRVARGNTRIAMMSSSRLTASVLAVHTENDSSTLIDVGHVLSAFGDLA